MGEPEQLQRLAARTRELAEELDRARPDLLSVTELNRALRHILATQASILEALAGVSLGAGSPAGNQTGTHSRPQIRVTPTALSPSSGPARRPEGPRGDCKGFERGEGSGRGQRIELDPDDLPDDPILDLEPVEEFDELPACEPPRAKPAPARHDASGEPVRSEPARSEPVRELLAEPRPVAPAPEAGPRNGSAGANGNGHAASDAGAAPVGAEPARDALPPVGSMAATWLNETRVVPGYLARQFVSQFDNRDKDYDKGLDKLNRWIAAGGAGTPFQWRGDQAYLNLHGSGATSARNYEDQLMTRMGFSRRLGRLDVPGLEGEIVIYERPS